MLSQMWRRKKALRVEVLAVCSGRVGEWNGLRLRNLHDFITFGFAFHLQEQRQNTFAVVLAGETGWPVVPPSSRQVAPRCHFTFTRGYHDILYRLRCVSAVKW